MKKRGFITIATGKEEYYRLAENLLHSYRAFCDEPLPFAILCDNENTYTKDFDDIILFQEGATNSYLDKLSLAEYLPYETTIFIDADCLAYGNLNLLFRYFEEADDFSCFGRVLSLDDTTGWFEYAKLGKLQKAVSYVIGLHGGVYYMKAGEIPRKIFETARSFIPEYYTYGFKGNFATPGDEPVVALSMAVNGCRPIPFRGNTICCYWEYTNQMRLDLSKGLAAIKNQDSADILLVHWGTRYTREYEYRRQIELLNILRTGDASREFLVRRCIWHYDFLIAAQKVQRLAERVRNRVKRIMHLQ